MVTQQRHGAGPSIPRALYLAGSPAAPIALTHSLVLGYSFGQHHSRIVGIKTATNKLDTTDISDQDVVASALTSIYTGRAYIPTHAKRLRAHVQFSVLGSQETATAFVRLDASTATGTQVDHEVDVAGQINQAQALFPSIAVQGSFAAIQPDVVICEVDLTALTLGQLTTFDLQAYATDPTAAVVFRHTATVLWWDHKAG